MKAYTVNNNLSYHCARCGAELVRLTNGDLAHPPSKGGVQCTFAGKTFAVPTAELDLKETE